MSGSRQEYRGSYVTQRVLYRETLEVDEDPADGGIPVLNTGASVDGKDSRIFIYALLLGDVSSATIDVYQKAEEEGTSPYCPGPSSSSATPDELWALVTTAVLSVSGLIPVLNVPPGKFKVVVREKTGNGAVRILEQHAA